MYMPQTICYQMLRFYNIINFYFEQNTTTENPCLYTIPFDWPAFV